jgi:hypothetical protein
MENGSDDEDDGAGDKNDKTMIKIADKFLEKVCRCFYVYLYDRVSLRKLRKRPTTIRVRKFSRLRI